MRYLVLAFVIAIGAEIWTLFRLLSHIATEKKKEDAADRLESRTSGVLPKND